MKFARNRDANEKPIIEALRAAGASVQAIDGKGVPDLLVGYRGHTILLEVKGVTATGKTKRSSRKHAGNAHTDERGLLETQQLWWAAWKGQPPIVVRTPDEALAILRAFDEALADLEEPTVTHATEAL